MSESIDGTAEEMAEPEATEATGAQLAVRERRSEVIKPLDAGELVESFKAYQDLLPKLLADSDYQEAERGQKFVKKSGWRKIATAFDLDVQIVRSRVERDSDGKPARAEVWARAIAPSGRSMDGDGYCDVSESRFGSAKGRAKLENDLRTTATTRAMNRAISGLVGMGAVSSEEVDAPPFGPAASAHVAGSIRRAIAFILGGQPPNGEPVTEILAEIERGSGGYLPDIVARSIAHVAAMERQRRADEGAPRAENTNVEADDNAAADAASRAAEEIRGQV